MPPFRELYPMADDENPGQVPATPTPDTQPTPEPTDTPPTQEPVEEQAEEPFDRERQQRLIEKLRPYEKKAKQYEREIAEYKRKEQEAEQAKLSEQERLTKQLQQREAELEFERQSRRDQVNQYEVRLQAGKLGIIDPDVAVKLLDWGALEYADDGTPKDVEAALKALVKDKPYLLGQPQPTSTTNGPTRPSKSGERIYTGAQLQDTAFYREHKKDIDRAYKEGRVIA